MKKLRSCGTRLLQKTQKTLVRSVDFAPFFVPGKSSLGPEKGLALFSWISGEM